MSTANFNNGSVVDAAGATAFLYSGNNNYSGNVTFTGNNVAMAGGTQTVSGTLTANAGSTYSVTAGTVNFTDGSAFNLANNLNFTGGAINLTGLTTGTSVAAGSTLSLSGQTLGGSGVLRNLGTLNLASSTITGSLANQGTLNATAGTSQVNGRAFDQVDGTLTLAAGATLNKNTGSFNWAGGSIAGSGTLGGIGGAGFALTGGGLRTLAGPTLNVGNLDLPAGTLQLASGTLNAGGTTTLATGSLLDVTGGTFNATGGTVNVAGTLRGGGGAFNASTLNINPGGTLSGTGIITSNVNNNGIVSPGDSPGMLNIVGNYVQGPSGILRIDLVGVTQGVNYDSLIVSGDATIAGTLDVRFLGGFRPATADAFRLVTAGPFLPGTFTSVVPPAGYGGGAIYGATFADLGFTLVPTPTNSFNDTLAFVVVQQGLLGNLPKQQLQLLDQILRPEEARKKDDMVMLSSEACQ